LAISRKTKIEPNQKRPADTPEINVMPPIPTNKAIRALNMTISRSAPNT